jgi:hypothetical protein
MCLLIAEIMMLLGGLYALISGKLSLTKNNRLSGWRARVAGVILILPLPLAFLIGAVLGWLVVAQILPQEALAATGIIELVLVIGALVGSVIFAWLTKPPEPQIGPDSPQ